MSKQSNVSKIESWFATITYYGQDCPDDFVERSKVYLRSLDECLASVEQQQNGNDHVHAIFKMKGQNNTVKNKLKKGCYGKSARTKIPVNAIKLEKVKNTPKCVAYIIKDLEPDENPPVVSGFSQTWIQEQAKIAFQTTKVFQKFIYVKVDQVPAMLLKYCQDNDIRVEASGDKTNKDAFIELLVKISEEGYNTRLWSKHMSWIFAQFRLLQGDKEQSVKYWNGILHFD